MALLAALLGSASPALAQAVYGSIAGSVLDSTGATLPGANVTITSLERRTSDTVVTNPSGFYSKERLLPGSYEVKAEIAGFKAGLVSSVRVGIDAQTKVDLRLEVGEMTESISVSVPAEQLLKTDRADVATNFENKQITELPVLDRNFTKFLLLTPGTQPLQWQHAASENPQGSHQTMVNGQHFSGTGYQLDGTENRDPILGIIVINPNLEAIGEAKITSQNYDAEFGQAIAGVVSVQTKSGTNDLHGSVFEFYQGDKFLGWGTQARNPFTQDKPDAATGRLLPETKRHQFGGSLGGPILENKWFVFGDYQGTLDKAGRSRRVTVPTAKARSGDFSEYGVNVFDPATGQRFQGNVIPPNRLSAQALELIKLVPLPNQSGIRENYVGSGTEDFDAHSGDIRLDGRLTDRLNVFARYSIADFKRDGPPVFGKGGGVQLASLGGVSEVTNHSVALGMDYTVNPTTIWDVRFGFFRYFVDVLPSDFGTTPARDAGVPGLNLGDDFTSGLPMLEIEGPFGFQFGSGLNVNRCNCPLTEDESQFQIVSNVMKQAGNHTLKFGFDVRRAFNLRVPSDAHRSGQLFFSPERTTSPAGGGLGFATFLLGDVSFFNRYVSPKTDAKERQWRHFYYAQDTWRASRKLTLNYGVRLDIIAPQSVNEARNGGWLDLDTGEILVGGVGNVNLSGNVENALNFAPRVGVTYQLTDKTVVRLGYGRSYDIGVFGSTFGHSVTQNLPVLAVQELPRRAGAAPVFNLKDGPPAAPFPAVPDSGRFRLPNGVFARALAEKMRLPAVDAYNFTVQRALTGDLSVELGYVGNKGTHVFAGDGPGDPVNEPTLYGFPQVPVDQRKPFFGGPVPYLDESGNLKTSGHGGAFGWTQGIDYYCNCGDNRYDSLQVKLTKRFSRGYSALAHYTLQRVRQDNDTQFFFNRELDRGRPDWDRVHNFVITTLMELPFGSGKKFLANASPGLDRIVGGWQFNTNVTIQSGQPFNVTYRDAFRERDVGPNRPDLVPGADPTAGGRTRERWFNGAEIDKPGSAFLRPAPGTFGNLPRNHFTGPGYWRMDASLFKRFNIRDKVNIELRMEAVNLLNHVNLGNPDSEIGHLGTDLTDPKDDNPNPNAGRITSTAFFGQDPQRNFQFGVRMTF